MINFQAPKLIKDLGMRPINSIRKDTGKRANKRYGLFKCSCGKEFETQLTAIKNGRIKSCGCIPRGKTTHGGTNTRLYNIWSGIKTRVFNKKRKCSKDYVNRGITICSDWEKDFSIFKKWSTENGYSSGLTIDRINNDGNYEPNNCRWVTREAQMQNTRKLISSNTSGYRGVSKDAYSEKWVARISIKNKTIRIGVYSTKEEAAKEYDNYIVKNGVQRPMNFKIKQLKDVPSLDSHSERMSYEEWKEVR